MGGLKKGEGGVDNTNVLFSDETERRRNRSKGVITKDPHVAGLGLGALLVDDVDAAQQEATLPHTAMGLLVKMCRRVARTPEGGQIVRFL